MAPEGPTSRNRRCGARRRKCAHALAVTVAHRAVARPAPMLDALGIDVPVVFDKSRRYSSACVCPSLGRQRVAAEQKDLLGRFEKAVAGVLHEWFSSRSSFKFRFDEPNKSPAKWPEIIKTSQLTFASHAVLTRPRCRRRRSLWRNSSVRRSRSPRRQPRFEQLPLLLRVEVAVHTVRLAQTGERAERGTKRSSPHRCKKSRTRLVQ